MRYRYFAFLIIAHMLYASVGMLVFHYLEQPYQINNEYHLRYVVTEFLRNKTCVSEPELASLISSISVAVTGEDWGLYWNATYPYPDWSWVNSYFFAITVISTIGYGNQPPMTFGGRLFCMGYALIGIPLFLLILGILGGQLHLLNDKIIYFIFQKSEPRVRNIASILVLVVAGTLLLILLPAVGFMYLENWPYTTAIYYVFITLSTIGFGDFVPVMHSAYLRYLIVIWIFLGLTWFSSMIHLMHGQCYNVCIPVKEEKDDPEKRL